MTDMLTSLSFADNPALQPTLSRAFDEQERTFLWEVLLECVCRDNRPLSCGVQFVSGDVQSFVYARLAF